MVFGVAMADEPARTVHRPPAPAWPVDAILMVTSAISPADVLQFGVWENLGQLTLAIVGNPTIVHVWQRIA